MKCEEQDDAACVVVVVESGGKEVLESDACCVVVVGRGGKWELHRCPFPYGASGEISAALWHGLEKEEKTVRFAPRGASRSQSTS